MMKRTKTRKVVATSSLHTDVELLQCPCGGDPILQMSQNRIDCRDAAVDDLVAAKDAKAKGIVVSQGQLLKAVEDLQSDNEDVVEAAQEVVKRAKEAQLGTRKGIEGAENKARYLDGDVVEVRCCDCNSFIWRTDPEGGDVVSDEEANKRAIHYAVGCWNRAVEKLGTLKDCCKECTSDPKCRKVDWDGMVTVKCHHCGIKHYPLGNYVL